MEHTIKQMLLSLQQSVLKKYDVMWEYIMKNLLIALASFLINILAILKKLVLLETISQITHCVGN